MKKLVLILVLVFAFALPALANPFVDVPLNHWAYDAVQSLAAKGIVIGYPDGTFGGNRTLTRYEFAEATARVMAYVEGMDFASAEDVAILEKLAIEFADELASLGVTVADLEAAVGANSEAIAAMEGTVARHEKFFDPVKITGDINVEYRKVVFPTVGVATLVDQSEIGFEAEINDTTTFGIEMEFENILSENVNLDVDSWKFWLKHYGEDLSLWIGDVEPATIGLGLIYDYDTNEDFYGAWAQWNWGEDADNGTWTTFMNVDDFYVLNAAFALGDEDDVDLGVTVSYDTLAGDAIVAGANLAFDLTDEDSDDQVSLALEGGVFTDLATTAFGAALSLNGTFGDEDDIDMYLDAHYVQAGFVPTNSDFDADELGGEVGLGFTLTDNDPDEVKIVAGPYVGYTTNMAMTTPDAYVGLQLDFTNIDVDYPEEVAYISAEFSLFDGSLDLEGEYLNLVLGDTDEFVFNVHGEYTLLTAVPDYTAMLNAIYSFEDDPIDVVVEGRLIADALGLPLFSAEVQLQYALADKTDLYVGVEMNDWDADINDWGDSDEWIINDHNTSVYAGIDIEF
jgi:hypothetical protein